MSLDDDFKKTLNTNPINYDKVSEILEKFSLTNEFLTEIPTYKPELSDEPNIFIETLAWTMAFQSKPVECTLEAQLRVYELYPYLIYNIMFLRTIDQQREYFKKLLDIYQETRGAIREDDFGNNVRIYKNYLDNFEENFKKNSAVVNMNYLAGIRFDKINIPYTELPKNCLIVNVGYKLDCPEGTVISKSLIYGDIKDVEGITVTMKDVSQMKLNETVDVYSCKECYKIIGSGEMYNVAICYNDNPNAKKCLYTVSKNEIPKMFVSILTHGGTIYKVRNQTLRVYFSEMMTQRFAPPKNSTMKKDMDNIISAVSVQLRERYNEDVDKTIANWTGFNNDKIFDLWLFKLYEFDEFDEETHRHILNYNNYVCTIKAYFMPIEDYVD